MEAEPNSISQSDKKSIVALQAAVADVATEGGANFTEFDYLRWLQGFHFNVEAAANQLREHLRTYQLWELQNVIAEGEDPISAKYYPNGLLEPADDQNCFIFIEMIGRLDTIGLWHSANWLTLLRSRTSSGERSLEVIRKQESETGKQAWIIFIQDLDGMSWDLSTLWNLVHGPYKYKWLGDYWAQHYVEMFKKFIIINAPSVIYYLWTVVKPLVPQRTREKVLILGHNYQQELLQIVDKERLPKHWGGSRVSALDDCDQMCRDIINVPTPVPKNLYWIPKSDDPEPENYRLLSISANSFALVSIRASACAAISWYFSSDNVCTFGIHFDEYNPSTLPTESSEAAIENIHPNSQMESILRGHEPVFPTFRDLPATVVVPESGVLKCSKTGTYKLQFVNNQSWWHKLNIRYAVAVATK